MWVGQVCGLDPHAEGELFDFRHRQLPSEKLKINMLFLSVFDDTGPLKKVLKFFYGFTIFSKVYSIASYR